MEILDTGGVKEPAGGEPTGGAEGRVSIDRFEAVLRFDEREEEEKVEAAMALYEKAARARMPEEYRTLDETEPDPEELEVLEAQSRQLKLQQKCQDIAALLMVEELEDELEELEEEEPRRRRRAARVQE